MNELEWRLLEDKAPAESVLVAGVEVRPGDLVRLLPRKGGDIMDLALAGRTAAVESIEQDYEGGFQLAVALEDDPGKDLGMQRLPGHRFFFLPEEVEPLKQPAKILVAGIGNVFLGDDGFGVEVIRRLSAQESSKNVCIRDFGIRGYDLAYALLDGYDLTILVDAAPRGGRPGTLYVIEPDLTDLPESEMDAHAMNPVSVLRLAQSMGEIKGRVVLVACEPETLGGEEGRMGLSAAVSNALDKAVQLVRKLINEPQPAKEAESKTNGR